MIESVALIILAGSLIGMLVILLRKIPLLLELPETMPSHFSWKETFSRIKIKNSFPLKNFPLEIFLQKVLSRVRIITLKTDNKTSSWLQRLRERSAKKKFSENDNYWKEVRKRMR